MNHLKLKFQFLGLFVLFFLSSEVANAQQQLFATPNWPINASTTIATNGSVNNQYIINSTISSLPVLTATGTLHTLEFYFYWIYFAGIVESSPLTWRLYQGSSSGTPLDCYSEPGKTYADYWPTAGVLPGYASTTKFIFSGTQCAIATSTNYSLVRLEGSDSGASRRVIHTGSPNNYMTSIGYELGYTPTYPPPPPDPPLTTNPAENSFITITKPTPYGVTLPVGVVDTRAYFYFDVAQSTTTKTVIDIYDAVTNSLLHSANLIVPASSTVNFEMPVNFTMATGSKKIIASYQIASNNQDLLIPAESFFNVGTNTYLIATGLESPQAVPAGLTQIECSTFDVGCQFQKAIVFVFVPSQTVLNKFSTLWQELKYLKPFGYISVIYDQIKNTSASSTSAYTMPSVPFVDAIFTPWKEGIAFLLWGIFAFVFYNKRLKHIDI